MKRKMKASGNFVFPTMLQSVTRLLFSRSLKLKNQNQNLKIEN